jgi:outer membrane lipase/esterase
MARNWLRRVVLAAACTSVALLAACSSSVTESALSPSRFVAFGDGFGDVGQSGSAYTVNDGTTNVWTRQLVARYGQDIKSTAVGGLSFARANARVATKPDAAGVTATLTLTEQIDAFLGSNTVGPRDVFILNAGTADIVAEMAAVLAGKLAGRAMAAQTRRLVAAGAKFVMIVGPYNMGRSPWAIAIGQETPLEEASSRFNEDLLVNVVDLGANVLYVDAALQFNLMTATPAAYDFFDATTVVCNSVDAGPGIGIGAGQVNSALCNASTITPGLAYNSYIWADKVYPTPAAHLRMGDYAYDRLSTRW